MKALIFIFAICMFCVVIINAVDITRRPTTKEVQTMIKGDTISIFHINNAGKLQSCLYTLILIELNEIEGWRLEQKLKAHVKWMAAMEEQRQEMARDKFEEK